MTSAVAVIGVFTSSPDTVVDRSLEEMIFDAAARTAADAGLGLDEIDGVVISANDQVDGRVISCMVSAGAAGGVDRDLTMIASSGEHALVYGYLRLLSGQGRNVLVLGWGKPSESVAPDHAELVSAEPFMLRPIGMNDTVAAALQASALQRNSPPAEPASQVSGEGGEGGEVVCWPLTRDELPARTDAVYGAVLAIPDAVPADASTAWIQGVGWATDRYELGDRDLAGMPALRVAAEQAGVRTATRDGSFDAVEIFAASEPAVQYAASALGIERGRGDAINPSGDLREAPAPLHVAGLARLLAAAEHVRRSRSDDVGGHRSVGAALHGFAGQGATVMVFDSDKVEWSA